MSRIITFAEISGQTQLVGEAFVNLRRGKITATFSYAPEYLRSDQAYSVDPSLPLTPGAWALATGLPRAFSDAAPDRWGRNLISKRIRAQAARDKKSAPQLDERDYLLGVSDITRQGALRFKTTAAEDFQHPETQVPKLISLPQLLRAADIVARDENDEFGAVTLLLDSGAGALGGARPKASVRDGQKSLIAKFPHHNDKWNVIAWEKTALDLAEAAGITVPDRQLVEVDQQAVLVLDRFDRHGPRRVGYVSAMTVLQADDGQTRDYIDIAEAIPEYSVNATADLNELWRRIIFSIAIHNTDDHLRNHGFIRDQSGWGVSPIFDINPNPELSAHRVTSIGGATDPVGGLTAAMTYLDNFGITAAQAHTIRDEVAQSCRQWRTVAKQNSITDNEINRFGATLDQTIELVADLSALK